VSGCKHSRAAQSCKYKTEEDDKDGVKDSEGCSGGDGDDTDGESISTNEEEVRCVDDRIGLPPLQTGGEAGMDTAVD